MSRISFREYPIFCIIRMWVELAEYGPSHFSKSVFWARLAGPLFGLLWRDTGMARSPLRFWAGEWDTWPISLSLSVAPQPLCTDCVGKGCNYSYNGCYLHVSARVWIN